MVSNYAMAFAAEYHYRKKNPTSKQPVPPSVYDDVAKKFKRFTEKMNETNKKV